MPLIRKSSKLLGGCPRWLLQVPDAQVKLCPGAGHGFVHRPMAKDKQNAEDAILLATSWLEMYMRKHFRVEAKGVKEDEFGFWELPSKEKSPT